MRKSVETGDNNSDNKQKKHTDMVVIALPTRDCARVTRPVFGSRVKYPEVGELPSE